MNYIGLTHSQIIEKLADGGLDDRAKLSIADVITENNKVIKSQLLIVIEEEQKRQARLSGLKF
ncbi:hypothetical protein [Bacillus sp. ISL-46]|uniref:hypothetical protein n=1 Tax=Bacillus sp. ISL-46 TaxID=2819129 RepID=UPI001BE572E1|nr:hypothetical protein [Bacillus sp. ISL-46]MBT2722302.1 hypothetical protein [Bacillus sp. ISL-46]